MTPGVALIMFQANKCISVEKNESFRTEQKMTAETCDDKKKKKSDLVDLSVLTENC